MRHRGHSCFLEDDGTLDTVVSVDGVRHRFNSENVERDEATGCISSDELRRLWDEVIDDL